MFDFLKNHGKCSTALQNQQRMEGRKIRNTIGQDAVWNSDDVVHIGGNNVFVFGRNCKSNERDLQTHLFGTVFFAGDLDLQQVRSDLVDRDVVDDRKIGFYKYDARTIVGIQKSVGHKLPHDFDISVFSDGIHKLDFHRFGNWRL